MKNTLYVLCAFIALAQANNYCYLSAEKACGSDSQDVELKDCTAQFGGLSTAVKSDAFSNLNSYVMTHIDHSFHYLMMSVFYGSYKQNRPGFQKLYRELSDDTWEDAIKLIKYITKRGGNINFNSTAKTMEQKKNKKPSEIPNMTYEDNELMSLSRAIDLQKLIAVGAHSLHKSFSQTGSEATFDPDVTSFLEKNFLHKHSETIRKLSGHLNDLKNLVKHVENDSQQTRHLSVFLFDQHLSSQ